ncbi:hypothetical protein BDAP_000893 [Binucleata daphniae]
MKFVQRGRLVTFTNPKQRNMLGVILDIQDAKFVTIQHVMTLKRERVSLNNILLLDICLDVAENITAHDMQRVFDKECVVKKYEESEEYKNWENNDKYEKMNDFERFMDGVKKRIENELIEEKGML